MQEVIFGLFVIARYLTILVDVQNDVKSHIAVTKYHVILIIDIVNGNECKT